jgi:hypothetical protein
VLANSLIRLEPVWVPPGQVRWSVAGHAGEGMGRRLGFRFNPPPGWPPSPAGFVPPPGWQPDPRWPDPPPGWQFWLADGDPPSAAARSEVAGPYAAQVPSPAAHLTPRQQADPGRVPFTGQGPRPGQPAYPGRRASPRHRRRSGRWLLVGRGAAGVVLVVVVVALVFFPAGMKGGGTRPGPRILVPAPAAAGGLTRDYAAERTIYRPALAQLRSRFKPAWLGAASSCTAAVYDEPGRTDPVTKAPVRLIFLGVNAAPGCGDPSTNLSTYMAGIAAGIAGHGTVGRPTQVPAGPGGGSAECAQATAASGEATLCVWATGKTIGTLAAAGGAFVVVAAGAAVGLGLVAVAVLPVGFVWGLAVAAPTMTSTTISEKAAPSAVQILWRAGQDLRGC